MKTGRDLNQVEKHKKRFKEGGIVCNKCKQVKKPKEYRANKSQCSKCITTYYKKRYQKSKVSLW